jgi:hypothetical protein
MTIVLGADPDVGPGRRDHELSDALQRMWIADDAPPGVAIHERAAVTNAADSRFLISHILQTR